MTPNLEQQEAWAMDQFRRIARELDVPMDVSWDTKDGHPIVHIEAPDAVSDIVCARLQTVVDHLNA